MTRSESDENCSDGASVEELTVAASKGDASALSELLERMLPDLRAFVRLRAGRLVRRHDHESDIVQSVCREVLEHADRFQYASEDAFRRWLFTTTLRKLSNRRDSHLAARRQEGLNAMGATDQSALLDVYARVATPSRHVEAREECARIEAAMAELSDDERAIIVLTRVAQISRADIAAELGIGESAVRMRLHRALAKLGVLITNEDEPRSGS